MSVKTIGITITITRPGTIGIDYGHDGCDGENARNHDSYDGYDAMAMMGHVGGNQRNY